MPAYNEVTTQNNNGIAVTNPMPLIEKNNTNAVINHDSDDDDTDDESTEIQILPTQLLKVIHTTYISIYDNLFSKCIYFIM